MTEVQPLWQPTQAQIAMSNLNRFRELAEAHSGQRFQDYQALHAWSIKEREKFWPLVWDFTGVVGRKGDAVVKNIDAMPGASWFPEASLNYAENCLSGIFEGKRSHPAIYFWAEDQVKRKLTLGDVYDQVAGLATHFRAQGVQPGDRVAAIISNMPEAVITALAANAVGAVFSSCSPDFGDQLILDRFKQIEPKILVVSENYLYKGKAIDCLPKLRGVLKQLSSVQQVIMVSYLGQPKVYDLPKAITWQQATQGMAIQNFMFTPLPFNHPLYILYSSGTTGLPKCFVHSQGGVLLEHVKEHQLHCDIRPHDVVFYQTTTGWMMWNWLVTVLASGAAIALYDGIATANNGKILFDYAADAKFTLFGTSAPFVQAIKNMNLRPKQTHDLSSLRLLTSTGAPLLHEHFDYLYNAVIHNIPVASISGGSDIVGCFVMGNPISPVYRGEIQCAGLGFDMAVFDDAGNDLPPGGGAGEMVCRKAFPCMPTSFWGDPSGEKYRAAYFERFPNIWCHGDWAERTAHNGLIIHGRSDATINRQGIRIGTAEFYNIVEQLPEIDNSLVVPLRRGADEKVLLFVKLKQGQLFGDPLKQKINALMREKGSPRHVPDEIHEVPDVPQTRNAKKAEMAIINLFHGRPVTNLSAIANASCLDFYRDFAAKNGWLQAV